MNLMTFFRNVSVENTLPVTAFVINSAGETVMKTTFSYKNQCNRCFNGLAKCQLLKAHFSPDGLQLWLKGDNDGRRKFKEDN